MIKDLVLKYKEKKKDIKKRLEDFRAIWGLPDKKIFSELCFCICTPQSKAVYCDKSIRGLEQNGMLFKGDPEQIREGLKAVRFPNNKAGYIYYTRKLLSENGRIKIKDRIKTDDIESTREWLVKNIKGLGYKESSHFLRNIGLGKNISILDTHILKNLKKFGVIEKIPSFVTGENYTQVIEEKMRRFAERIKVPLEELDLLLWSLETGFVFK